MGFLFAIALVTVVWVNLGFSVVTIPVAINQQSRTGAVSSLDARCTQIGADILRRGGNAADATVAVQFCLGVVGMHLCGIGGGGFMLVRDAHGDYEFIDFRESAPAASTENMYDENPNGSVSGGLASGIPGEVRGLQYLHERYGSMAWSRLVMPAVEIARNGFIIGEDLNFSMDQVGNDTLFTSAPWAEDFAPQGRRLRAGDKMSRKRYANTLLKIGQNGPDAFYSGEIAETMLKGLAASDGIMTFDDLLTYRAVSRPPRSIEYHGFKIHSCSSPCGGVVALNILNTLKGYSETGDQTNINLTTHRLDEAMRFAYGARTKLGDPSFVHGIEEYEALMLAENAASEVRSRILDNKTQPVEAYNPDLIETLENHGTSHVSAADASGMAISLTSSVNLIFGSHLMIPETGIIMNNEMNDFSLPNLNNPLGLRPSPANLIKPGKRPLSAISPVIVEYIPNGTLHTAIGAAGGARIITAVAQGLWNILDRRMTIIDAIREPRFHEQLSPNQMKFEYEYNNATISSLREKGHGIGWLEHGSDLQMVRRLPDGNFEAASETRQKDSGGLAV